MKSVTSVFVLFLGVLSACSTAFWYDQAQFAQYDKCENLSSPEERRRCKAETYPDYEKFKKEREAARGASK